MATKQTKQKVSLAQIFAQRVKEVRVGKDLGQAQVAAKANISTSYISMLERGLRTPPLDTVEAVAKALGVEPIELLKAA